MDNPLTSHHILELKRTLPLDVSETKFFSPKIFLAHKFIHQESWQNLTEKKSS